MLSILVGSRASKLALKQVEEVFMGLKFHHSEVAFSVRAYQTHGDLDQKTSLKTLGQTNFFTKELDEALLNGELQITIHSAKDLPDPLPKGLQMVALTACRNNEDALVLPLGKKLEELSDKARFGVSSTRREEEIRKLFPNAECLDIRGTIEKRLQYLETGELDGVIIAKVALQRLGLSHLNIFPLSVQTPPLQGSLAILARESDREMEELFGCIDSRRGQKTLYLGLDPMRFLTHGPIIHAPIIQTVPLKEKLDQATQMEFKKATHVLFTSGQSIKYLFELFRSNAEFLHQLSQKSLLAVGLSTKHALNQRGCYVDYTAKCESQEGLIELLSKMRWSPHHHLFYPHSQKARQKLILFLKEKGVSSTSMSLYDTLYCEDFNTKINLQEYQEIVFTSPTCVKYFFEKVGELPGHITPRFIGPITKSYFENNISSFV